MSRMWGEQEKQISGGSTRFRPSVEIVLGNLDHDSVIYRARI